MRLHLAAALAIATASVATAQLAPGTIADGDVVYTHVAFPASNAAAGGLANFRGTGASGQDHLYQVDWFWRLATDAREFALHAGGGQGAMSSTYAGGRVLHTWAALDGRGFAAARELRVFGAGPAAGFVVDKLTITNHTAAPVQLNLFAYVDGEHCASAPGDRATANPHRNKLALRDAACAVAGEVYAPGADHFEIAPFPDVVRKLTDTVPDRLSDVGLPFGPDDFTGAWQWRDRTVAPGGSLSVWLVLGIDAEHSGCTRVASTESFGAGKRGTWGVPLLDPATRPLLGTLAPLTIDGGYPGGAPFCLLGSARTNQPLPPYGTLLVAPQLTLFGGTFDPARRSRTPIPIPNAVALCAVPVHFQAFMADPGAVGGIAHTAGLTWTLGGLF